MAAGTPFAATSTVYLTEDAVTSLAETMFYFHREVLTALDAHHILGVFPSFEKKYALWEITFKQDVDDLADLAVANASAFGVFPALMLNPSQDYHHLRAARGRIQANGYNGLVAPATRVMGNGNMVVAFSDQSKNVATIQAHPVDFRLIWPGGPPARTFANHVIHLLSYGSGEVRFQAGGVAGFGTNVWQIVHFNH